MQRRFKDYFLITLKGVAMGAADAVPGVSGGTIALISGIYQELISTISGVNISLITTLYKKGFNTFWKELNGNFILALLIGIFTSFALFMRLAKYLIEMHPVLIWSFFFGLIIASIYFVGKQINKWTPVTIIALIIGTFLAYYITTLPSMANNSNPLFLFIAGAIAICAMILPGISGSFILVILGAYKTLSDAIHDWDFKRIAIFGIGALVGLLSFSRILKWLFKNYQNITLAVLTGFIIGSINKIWPWKKSISVIHDITGETLAFSEVSNLGTLSVYQQQINNFDSYKIVTEESISPFVYSAINNDINPQLIAAISLIILGFLTIFILEKIGNKQG